MFNLKNWFVVLLSLSFLFLVSCSEDTVSPEQNEEEANTVTDIDGNVYSTIQIGNQLWMAENLKTTSYTNGEIIPNIILNSQWAEMSFGAYCAYENTEGNVDDYGLLYNGFAVTGSRKIAPIGWHIPSDEEWKELEMHLGMFQVSADSTGWRGTLQGAGLKSASRWNGNNVSGFTAFHGGYRAGANNGIFHSEGDVAYFWSSTLNNDGHLWMRNLGTAVATVGRFFLSKEHGASIRCIKDTSGNN